MKKKLSAICLVVLCVCVCCYMGVAIWIGTSFWRDFTRIQQYEYPTDDLPQTDRLLYIRIPYSTRVLFPEATEQCHWIIGWITHDFNKASFKLFYTYKYDSHDVSEDRFRSIIPFDCLTIVMERDGFKWNVINVVKTLR